MFTTNGDVDGFVELATYNKHINIFLVYSTELVSMVTNFDTPTMAPYDYDKSFFIDYHPSRLWASLFETKFDTCTFGILP